MSNDAIAQLVEAATEKFSAANVIAEKVAKSHGSVAKDVKEARENSDDATVVKFREWFEKAQAKINDEIEKINAYIVGEGNLVSGNTMTDAEVEAAKAEHKELKKAAQEAWSAAETVAKILGATMPEKPEVLTFSGKPSASGSGTGATGGRRLRFAKVEVNGAEVKNLSAVSQKIYSETSKRVSAAELQKALFESAGTEDVARIGDHSFSWSETDAEGVNHSYDISVYAKTAAETAAE